MAYSINLYEFSKKVNSTKRPSGTHATKSCRLKNGCSIQHPVFVIEGSTLSNYQTYNYLTFNGCYYYIDDVKAINNRVCEVTASMDVLATYKQEIGNTTCVISRCSDGDEYNLYDVDNVIHPTNYIISNFEISKPSGFSFSVNDTYTLTYYGKDGARAVNTGQFNSLNNNLFNNTTFWDTVNQVLFDPSQYVKSLIHLPCSLGGMENVNIKLGSADPITVVGFPINFGLTANYTKLMPTISLSLSDLKTDSNFKYVNDYRSIDDRFTKLSLWLPFVGSVHVPSSILSHNGTIDVKYRVDMVTGQGECLAVYNLGGTGSDEKEMVLSKSNINIGAEIPLGVSDSAWGSVLSNAFNPVEMAKLGIEGLNPRHNYNMVGTANTSAYIDIENVKLFCTQYESDDIDSYVTTKGVPTNKELTIKNLSGYIEVLNPSVDVPSRNGVADTINNYLESGFYYE